MLVGAARRRQAANETLMRVRGFDASGVCCGA
jgi:hypothetical protein